MEEPISVIFVTPYPGMEREVEEVFRQFDRQALRYRILSMTPDQEPQISQLNSDVVIARGFSAAFFRQEKIPVVELNTTGYDLILATNPLFPAEGVHTRLSWIGLSPEDFSLITTYDNSTFCKPFPGYYQEILQKTGKTPAQCRMVGNNPLDDMSAAKLGLDVYLVTDYIENEKGLPIDGFPQGSLASVLAWSEALPEV